MNSRDILDFGQEQLRIRAAALITREIKKGYANLSSGQSLLLPER
jgi:hypothetical protein